MEQKIDHYSFIYGMVTAFSECVSRECKRGALSPPFPLDYHDAVVDEIKNIASENGISCWYDENKDLPESCRVGWFVLYKFQDALEEYRGLRATGANPALDMKPFHRWLGYGSVWTNEYAVIQPAFRELRDTGDTPGRVLFPDGGWPPT